MAPIEHLQIGAVRLGRLRSGLCDRILRWRLQRVRAADQHVQHPQQGLAKHTREASHFPTRISPRLPGSVSAPKRRWPSRTRREGCAPPWQPGWIAPSCTIRSQPHRISHWQRIASITLPNWLNASATISILERRLLAVTTRASCCMGAREEKDRGVRVDIREFKPNCLRHTPRDSHTTLVDLTWSPWKEWALKSERRGGLAFEHEGFGCRVGSAGAGALVGGAVGSKVGIAALGTAIAGTVPVAIVGAGLGLGLFATYKLIAKKKKAKGQQART